MAKSFFQNVVETLNELKTLRVSTYIGGVKSGTTISANDMKVGQGQDKVISSIEITDTMVSKIDLLQGDITTAMTPNFESNNTLREYHTMREQQAHEIVERNIKVLKSIGGLIEEFKPKA